MRIHLLQHVHYEGPGCIRNWCSEHNLSLIIIHLYRGEPLPNPREVDFLIVMGGPMSIDDAHQHPWLLAEQDLIRYCIEQGKTLLGICLGAQMIAHCLGAHITKNPNKEIGWYPLQRHDDITSHPLANIFPPHFDAFHWHGDTFSLPADSLFLASSEACRHQGFIYHDRVVALQFHLEMNLESAQQLITHGHADLVPAPYIQSSTEILSQPERFKLAQQRMIYLLNYMRHQIDAE